MNGLTLLGFLAGTLTTVAFFPQFLKVWKSQSTHDISLAMYIVITTGVLLWLIYGIFLHDYPIIIANAVTFVIALSILILKLKYK